MSELYERLLAKVAAFTEDPPRCAGDRPWFCGGDDYDLAVAATRAVLELHKPAPCGWSTCSTPDVHRVCDDCGPHVNFTECKTVRAIARALDVEVPE